MLNEVADASILAIENLKENVDAAALRRAVEMLDGADTIHVVGCEQDSWIASYLFYELTRLGCRCYRLNSPGDTARLNVSPLGAGDLVVAVCLSDDDDSAVRVAAAAHAREVPVLALAHSIEHPLSSVSSLFIAMPASPGLRLQPWAVRMVFAQALLAMLEARRSAQS